MTLRLRLAILFGALLLVLSGLFVIAMQGQLVREMGKTEERAATGTSEQAIHAALQKLTAVWVVAGVPVMGLCFLLGFLVASRSVRHLREINAQLADLQPGNLGNRITAPDNDPEVGELVGQINALLSRVGRSYEELAEFSARVAHELRTPLTLLRMRVEESAAGLPPEFSEDLQEEIRRLSRLVERSLATARAQGGRLPIRIATADLSALLGSLREDYDTLAEARGISLTWDVPAGLAISTDKDLLKQILHNLLDNAIRHGSGRAHVRAARSEDGQSVVVEVRNDMAPSQLSERGAGIGLRLIKAFVATMPGMEFSAQRDGGQFSALLVCPGHATAQAVSPVLGGTARGTAWIVVRGRGTFQNSAAVAAFAAQTLETGCKSFALDLAGCTNADSAFLGTVAALGLRLQRSGGVLFFARADEHMRRLLADYGLQNLASRGAAPEPPPPSALRELPLDAPFEMKRRVVIEAHEALASLTPENKERFRDALDFLRHKVPED